MSHVCFMLQCQRQYSAVHEMKKNYPSAEICIYPMCRLDVHLLTRFVKALPLLLQVHVHRGRTFLFQAAEAAASSS